VNNAGVEFAGGFRHQTRQELETIAAVNFVAVMELTRVTLPGMLERGRGHIVNVASIAGKGAFPYLASYCATKHGVVGFTHSPEDVGAAVVSAIRDDRAEVLVSRRPKWVLPALSAVSPKTVSWLLNRRRFREFADGYARALGRP
jgi:short chain dehydrogenase